MPVFEAEAIVLRQYALSEADRIVVMTSREFGRIRGVVKGVKKPQNRIGGGLLEPLNHVRVEGVAREGRDLGQINRVELVHSFLGRSPSLDQVYAFTYFAEITGEMVQDNHPNQAFFRLLLASLQAGESNGVNPLLVRYFEIWSLKLSGFFPNHVYCSICGKCVKDEGFFAWYESGEARCSECAEGRGLRISAEASEALQSMTGVGPAEFMVRSVANGAAIEIERLSQRLLSFHLERNLKSYPILREALRRQ